MGVPVCQITSAGIVAPTFDDVLTYLQTSFQSIYGQDIYIEPDSQDGQFLALIAAAVNDANAMAVAVYNAFSPATAKGAGLSSNVKLNGIARKIPSFSTSDAVITGQAGSTIDNGLVEDQNGFQWALPASVTIPYSGAITVTATCTTLGAISAPAGTITQIVNPTLGWQAVNNPTDAAVGNPVETDAQLRIRQSQSTMLPAQTGLDGLVGAVLAVPGVSACIPWENDDDVVDANGIPPNSVALVITGGDDAAIASAMLLKKMSGTKTYGTTSIGVIDQNGVNRIMNFFRPTTVNIDFTILVRALAAYTADVSAAIKNALADWINGLPSGQDVEWGDAFGIVRAAGKSFKIEGILIGANGGPQSAADVPITFYQEAIASPSDVTVTLV